MTFFVILLGVLALIVFISWGKVNAFLLVALPTGFALGLATVQKGLGDTLGSVALVVPEAMLGRLVAESGAAQP